MQRTALGAFMMIALMLGLNLDPANANSGQYYEVVGVEGDDMLKLRAGPGTGYRIIVGLPNGTVLRLHDCQQIGSTEWCKVSLKEARSLTGYVSWHYLKGL
ncbi:SH3 domain-containing protein [Primorskyibacter sp. S87]|uniref:SH3 domain-containing protein n=1 Tax=Primorskyibacter sp. S87 TaxID=3415126 RepID=UPI003C7BCC49